MKGVVRAKEDSQYLLHFLPFLFLLTNTTHPLKHHPPPNTHTHTHTVSPSHPCNLFCWTAPFFLFASAIRSDSIFLFYFPRLLYMVIVIRLCASKCAYFKTVLTLALPIQYACVHFLISFKVLHLS